MSEYDKGVIDGLLIAARDCETQAGLWLEATRTLLLARGQALREMATKYEKNAREAAQ